MHPYRCGSVTIRTLSAQAETRHCDLSPGLCLLVTPSRLSGGHEWTLLCLLSGFRLFWQINDSENVRAGTLQP